VLIVGQMHDAAAAWIRISLPTPYLPVLTQAPVLATETTMNRGRVFAPAGDFRVAD
jgi:hypothetical protein